MFQLRFVIGVFIGFQFNIIHKVLNATIIAENDLKLDYNADMVHSLFDQPDRSMNGAEENELRNIFINPEETGPYLEGDIFSPDDITFKNGHNKSERIPKIWPNGVVPFDIGPNFTQPEREMIRFALSQITAKTCLRFPNRTTEADYAHFSDVQKGCFSIIGYKGGKHIINLQRPNCLQSIGKIQHETLHALGFFHEHARNDRDDYVKVMWENIKKDQKFSYKKRRHKIDPSVDFTYDYGSVMHYSRYAFAIDSTKPTLIPLFDTIDSFRIGQRVGLSPLDIKKLNAKYHCENMMMTAINKTKKEGTETNVHFELKSKEFWMEFNFTSNHEKTYFRMIDLLKNETLKPKTISKKNKST